MRSGILLVVVMLPLWGCGGLETSAPAMRVELVEPVRTLQTVNGQKVWAGDGCIARLREPDHVNGANAATLPVSKARAKTLLVDAATPIGFRFDEPLPDEVVALIRTVDSVATLSKSPEGHLYARFSESPEGTEVYVNTDSLEVVMKSRDSSYAGRIVSYMWCLNRLLDYDAANPPLPAPFDATHGQGEPIVELMSMRVLSSRTAYPGQVIHYRVKQDVLLDGQRVIARGAPATGRVVSATAAGWAGGGRLRIAIDRVQDVDGHWRALHFANGRDAIQMGVESDMRGAVQPTEEAPRMSGGPQPALAAGSIVMSRLVDTPGSR